MGVDIAGPVVRRLRSYPRRLEDLAQTGRLVEAAGVRWREACIDQRDLPALRAAAEEARAAFGRLDILFANAGIQAFKPILDCEDADWQDTIDVDLTGTCNAIRAVAPHLVEERRRTHHRRFIRARKTRHQIRRRLLRLQMRDHRPDEIGGAAAWANTRSPSNAVIPGLIDTPLTRHRQRYAQAVDDFRSKQPTAALEAEAGTRLSAKSPLGVPWIEPEARSAPADVFLASDAAFMVSGATYDVTRRRQRQLHGLAASCAPFPIAVERRRPIGRPLARGKSKGCAT